MIFTMPTLLYQEENCVAAHAKKLCTLGSRALIVTGKSSSKKNGALSDVTAALESGGVCFELFDEIEENPSVETVMKAAEKGRCFGADFVVGIGGGSPLDAAKAVALMVKNADKDSDFLCRNVPAAALPVAAVPTTCGTGSEVTAISVLTVHSRRTKASIPHRIFPALALVDGKYLEGAPVGIIRSTAVDALCHLVESRLSAKSDEYSRMCSDSGLLVFAQCRSALEAGVFSRNDLDRLMTASAMAGMAISLTGTTVPHGLSYRVTYELGIPHGKAAGMFLGGFLAQAPEADREAVLALAGFSSVEDYERFFAAVCPPEKVSDSVISDAVSDLLANPAKLNGASFPISRGVLERIAERAVRA